MNRDELQEKLLDWVGEARFVAESDKVWRNQDCPKRVEMGALAFGLAEAVYLCESNKELKFLADCCLAVRLRSPYLSERMVYAWASAICDYLRGAPIREELPVRWRNSVKDDVRARE
jgi:hypothetical protein